MSSDTDTIVLSKVRQAQRRMIAGQFGRSLNRTLFVSLLVSTLAIGAMAIVPLPQLCAAMGMAPSADGTPTIEPGQWIVGWLVGTVGIAVAVAALHAWWRAPSLKEVAAEIDHRFDLHERLSSSLAVSQTDGSPQSFATALRDDAARQAESIRIADKFPLRAGSAAWLPLSIVPILAVMIAVVQPASTPAEQLANSVDSAEVRQVKTVAAELKKRVSQQRRTSEAKGLEEARALFENMEQQLDQITKNDSLDRKDALIQLNDIKEQIEARKGRLGSPDDMRKALAQMKGIGGGPAQKIADQIQRGDFGQAAEELRKLAEKLKDGQLSEQEKEKLAGQAKQLAQQMKSAVERHEQKKQQLQQQIEQAKREGRSEDAAKLQQKLNNAQAADAQMQQMQNMAQSMENAAEAMQQGDTESAAQEMEGMSEQLGEMQSAMSELEDLQSTLDDLAQSKNQMNCQNCNGQGCEHCMGQNGNGTGGLQAGSGLGPGPGEGDDSDQDTNTYDSKVQGDVKRGRAVITGFADGPNRKGITRETIKNVIEASMSEEEDALDDQLLPRDERDQTQQYFDSFRDGS
ncbi:hypothetical protein [Allorhodopirellula solitaria]|uniref:Chromosome segregation protein n=1 Tax=Allorhodopirellula solitaria TaxID=2527987 RepID=A0A5C5YJS8_9BACT|nr:hypothetical protein [Allorhodopirellula solitaria]TWT75145.1 chromosome segregation protein [Allorhodopirellula solitaria]